MTSYAQLGSRPASNGGPPTGRRNDCEFCLTTIDESVCGVLALKRKSGTGRCGRVKLHRDVASRTTRRRASRLSYERSVALGVRGMATLVRSWSGTQRALLASRVLSEGQLAGVACATVVGVGYIDPGAVRSSRHKADCDRTGTRGLRWTVKSCSEPCPAPFAAPATGAILPTKVDRPTIPWLRVMSGASRNPTGSRQRRLPQCPASRISPGHLTLIELNRRGLTRPKIGLSDSNTREEVRPSATLACKDGRDRRWNSHGS